MHIDSIREIKATLAMRVLAPLSAAALAGRVVSLSARRVGEAVGIHRTLAMGIARHGKKDFRLAVRLQRRGLEASPELERIRALAKGEIDVRYVGHVGKRALPWHQRRNRPLRVGGSIGHFAITAGTLGCFVRARGGRHLILSNNHVLADENRARIGDAVVQPGRLDGGRRRGDTVGALVKFVRMTTRRDILVDCALAGIDDAVEYDYRNLTGIGTLAGAAPGLPDPDVQVAKVGRTTGTTRGRVTAFEVDNVVVEYDIGNLTFDNQIEIEGEGNAAFSDGGDSGSLIVDADRMGVALLFAGSDQGGDNGRGLTYANPLRAVLDALRVDLLF